MKFSIVIPLYNKERHISRAINSVLSQTINEFELIVVDDGSTDSSYIEAKKFNDNRIKLVSQSNSGVSAARNKGISLAQYDYIGFLDADDSWEPNFLKCICKLISDYPEAGAYATSYHIIEDASGKKILPRSVLGFADNWEGIIDDYFKYALKAPIISASSVVIPKRVFKNVGTFKVGVKRGEDLDMWCRIALEYEIAFSNKVCATYYRDADNRACNRKVLHKESFTFYSEEILNQVKNEMNYSIYFEEYMINRIINKARYFIEENKRKDARDILYKYRHTKYNKKLLIKTYILSWIPWIGYIR
jgi:glycosyltransferase involved in cell wall biosynthesis